MLAARVPPSAGVPGFFAPATGGGPAAHAGSNVLIAASTTAFATVAVRGATIFSRNTKSSSRRSAMHSLASAGGASKVIQPSTAT